MGRAGGSVEPLSDVIAAAAMDAGLDHRVGSLAPVGVYCLAGADFRADERRIERSLAERGWTRRNVIRNDTFAVLRAGTDRGWGVAVVCGAGMNCMGVHFIEQHFLVRLEALANMLCHFGAELCRDFSTLQLLF